MTLVALSLPAALAWARQVKSVFHGLSTEPESGLRPGAAAEPIALAPIWTFDGFDAPLAGDPAAAETTIVAADRAGQLAALDPAGSPAAWRVDLREPLSIGPAVVGGTILQATSSGVLLALDVRSGQPIWRSSVGAAPIAPPLPAGARLLLATEAPELIALRPEDGVVLGRRPLPGRPVAPVVEGDVVIVGTEHGMVLAIDTSTLEVRWRRYLRHAVTAPPLVHDGKVYVALADRTLHCLRFKSGRKLWRQRTGSITGARLLARDGLLYVLCYDNDIYLLKPRNGHLVGRVRLDHRLILDGVATDTHLFVAPFTEGTVLGLTFPALAIAGRFRLEAKGDWFTTRPVVMAGPRLAVGYGRDAGRIVFLSIGPGEAAPDTKDSTDTKGTPAPGG